MAEEEPGERHATLLAAGEGRHDGVVGRAAQGVHRDVDVALEVPGVGRGDLVLEGRLLGTDRLVVGVRVGPRGHDGVVLVDQRLDLGHAVEHVALDVLGRVELGLLAQEADREAGGQAGLAHEPVVEAGHDPEEGGLAGPVRADDPDLGARVERERDVLEHGLVRRVVPGELVRRVDEFGGHAGRVAGSGARRPRGAGPREAPRPRVPAKAPTAPYATREHQRDGGSGVGVAVVAVARARGGRWRCRRPDAPPPPARSSAPRLMVSSGIKSEGSRPRRRLVARRGGGSVTSAPWVGR